MRFFENLYRTKERAATDARFYNDRFRHVDNRLHAIEELIAALNEVRSQLLRDVSGRVDDVLLPALEYVRQYQTGGFLVAPILDTAEMLFSEGSQSVAIDPDLKDLFRPTPFVALVRSGSIDDWAIAQALGFNAETGVLDLDIVAAHGSVGPFSDVIVVATAGSVQAQYAFLTQTRDARDAAQTARDAAISARNTASGHAGTASAAVGTATSAAGTATARATEAQKWATEAEDTPVSPGQFSARHHALKAAASAAAAALFDPSSYWTKGETYSRAEVIAAIEAAIADLIGEAPAALDTLAELAEALGEDAEFSTTILSQLAGKVDSSYLVTALNGKANQIHTHTVGQLSDASASGRALVQASTYAAMRTLLGLGPFAAAAVTVSTGDPSGGANGDVWLKVSA